MTGPPPRILVTRPRDDAEALAAELDQRGFPVMIQPMLEIRMLEGPPLDLDGVQALLFTSANGVRATAARTKARDLPALAVGDATARAARDEGFIQVESAHGDVESLARLVRPGSTRPPAVCSTRREVPSPETWPAISAAPASGLSVRCCTPPTR